MIMTMDKKFLTAAMTLAYIVDITRCGEYPAGLDPSSCPDYPNCDNAVLHGVNRGVEKSGSFGSGWDDSGSYSWNNPSSTAPLATAAVSWNSKPLAPARYPADVDPRSCPSYPNCDNAALHRNREKAFANARSGSKSSLIWNERNRNQERIPYAVRNWNTAESNSNAVSNPPPRYPAGINAQNCPDYPYC